MYFFLCLPVSCSSEVSQAAREIQQTNPDVLESLQRQVFQGMAGQGDQQQQQQAPEGGVAGDQVGSAEPQKDGGAKSTEETEGGPPSG